MNHIYLDNLSHILSCSAENAGMPLFPFFPFHSFSSLFLSLFISLSRSSYLCPSLRLLLLAFTGWRPDRTGRAGVGALPDLGRIGSALWLVWMLTRSALFAGSRLHCKLHGSGSPARARNWCRFPWRSLFRPSTNTSFPVFLFVL